MRYDDIGRELDRTGEEAGSTVRVSGKAVRAADGEGNAKAVDLSAEAGRVVTDSPVRGGGSAA